jgi:hypothetical protein
MPSDKADDSEALFSAHLVTRDMAAAHIKAIIVNDLLTDPAGTAARAEVRLREEYEKTGDPTWLSLLLELRSFVPERIS